MKTCPKCRTQHFDGVNNCDCGYNFSTGQTNPAPSTSNPSRPTAKRGWLAAGGTLVLMMIAGSFFGKMVGTQAASTVNQIEAATSASATTSQTSLTDKIQTFVVRQDATGYSNGDLDPLVIQRLEDMLVDGSVEKAKAGAKSGGYEPSDIHRDMYQSRSRLIEVNGQKFGVIDISSQAGKVKTIVTIRGNEFLRVNCIRKGSEEIPLFSGPCATQVEMTFGVKLPGID